MSEALKRVTAMLAAGTVGQVIVFLSRIMLVPLYLTAWGSAGYGQWVLVSSFAAYLATLDIGVQMYVMNRLTQAHSRGDFAEYHQQQNTAFAYYTMIAAVATAALALFAYTADMSRVLGTDMPRTEAGHLVVLLGAGVVWALPASIVWNTARTAGNPAASQWFGNLQSVGLLVLSAVALLTFPSMRAVAAIPLAAVLATCLAAFYYNRRHHPAIRLGFQGATLREASAMLRPSAFFGLIVLAVAIGQQVPLLLISHSLGVVAVAVFATSRTLTGLIRQVVSLLSNATWTDLTRLETQGDTERLSSALRILVATSMTAVISLAGTLWFDVASILALWTNGRIVSGLGLLQLMLLHLVVQTLWMSASNVPAATNRHRSLAMSYIASNVIAVALSALFLPALGLSAIPISFIVADLIACYHFVIRDACRISAIPYAGYMMKILTGSAAMIAGAWAVALAVHAAFPEAILARLATLSLLLPPIAASIAWFFLLTAEDRQRVAAWKGRMLLRRRVSEPAS